MLSETDKTDILDLFAPLSRYSEAVSNLENAKKIPACVSGGIINMFSALRDNAILSETPFKFIKQFIEVVNTFLEMYIIAMLWERIKEQSDLLVELWKKNGIADLSSVETELFITRADVFMPSIVLDNIAIQEITKDIQSCTNKDTAICLILSKICPRDTLSEFLQRYNKNDAEVIVSTFDELLVAGNVDAYHLYNDSVTATPLRARLDLLDKKIAEFNP